MLVPWNTLPVKNCTICIWKSGILKAIICHFYTLNLYTQCVNVQSIHIIENQYANEINSIVFVADRIADMFENGIIRDLVDKVKDDLTF